jgi:hypothetical protein
MLRRVYRQLSTSPLLHLTLAAAIHTTLLLLLFFFGTLCVPINKNIINLSMSRRTNITRRSLIVKPITFATENVVERSEILFAFFT